MVYHTQSDEDVGSGKRVVEAKRTTQTAFRTPEGLTAGISERIAAVRRPLTIFTPPI
jgi:hypothetical protein